MLPRTLGLTAALSALSFATLSLPALADDATQQTDNNDLQEIVVTTGRTTRSSVALAAVEAQKILPGISPLKAIETLPGVVYETADPWGNNEQNESLVVHGFTTQQLGYTMDGVPLGDQQYGNYNGLSVRAPITSENVRASSWAPAPARWAWPRPATWAAPSRPFPAIRSKTLGVDLRETGGSYDTTRTFVRFDSGEFRRRQFGLSLLSAPGRTRLGFRRPSAWRPGQPEVRPRRRDRQADLLRGLAVQGRAQRGRHGLRQSADRGARASFPIPARSSIPTLPRASPT